MTPAGSRGATLPSVPSRSSFPLSQWRSSRAAAAALPASLLGPQGNARRRSDPPTSFAAAGTEEITFSWQATVKRKPFSASHSRRLNYSSSGRLSQARLLIFQTGLKAPRYFPARAAVMSFIFLFSRRRLKIDIK